MTRRTALLTAAIVIAALGTLLVYLYVKSVQDTAYADQQPVTVLVAKEAVDVGTSGATAVSTGSFEEKVLPQEAVPADALSDAAPVATNVAVTTILPGQVVQQSMFGERAVNGALPMEKGDVAITAEFSDPQRVAGFVQPGSRVAVFATMDSGDGKSTTRLLLPRVDVAAVGATTAVPANGSKGAEDAETVPSALLTLGVNQREAEKIIFAQQNGSLYLALLNDSSKVAPSSGVNASNVNN